MLEWKKADKKESYAPVCKSLVSVVALHVHCFELVDHPPYSPDLAPSDCHLFLNNWLGTSVVVMVIHLLLMTFFDQQDKSFSTNRIEDLQHLLVQ